MHTVRIYSQNIGIVFGIEKYAMLIRKSCKRHLADEMELPNQDKIRTLREKEIYKYVGILESEAIKKWWKKALRKNISGELESYSRQNYVAETLSKE